MFLGLTMGCARCHDHKYDPITQTEFYQFLAFFNSTSDKGVYTEQRGNVPPLAAVPSPSQEKELARLDAGLARAVAARQAAESTLPARQRRWEIGLQAGPSPSNRVTGPCAARSTAACTFRVRPERRSRDGSRGRARRPGLTARTARPSGWTGKTARISRSSGASTWTGPIAARTAHGSGLVATVRA